MKKGYANFVKELFLFNGISEPEIDKIIADISFEERDYSKNEIIYSPNNFNKKIGFILNGECEVEKPSSLSGHVPLNKLSKGDSFGVVALFGDTLEFPTRIVSKTTTKILFLTQDDVIKIINISPVISLNIIKFLTGRIEFLNDRVAAFSGCSVEEKLVNYILELSRKYNSREFDFNKKRASEVLNCGRASLYRALDSLSGCGLIYVDIKKIYIKDPEGLERKRK